MNLSKSIGILFITFISNSFAANGKAYEELYNKLIKTKSTSPTPTTGIKPGNGYSSDTISIAPVVCYTPSNITINNQSSHVYFTHSMSYDTIINDFNINNYMNSGYGVFATDGMLGNLNIIKENNYTFSVDYYAKISHWVNIDYSYTGTSILNDEGKTIYANGNNPMFRLICGDKLVKSYEEGAGLIISLQIHFNDKSSKDTFKSKIGNMTSGSLQDAMINISRVANENKIQGNIELNAFQVGGNPDLLSNILNSNIVSCNVNNIAACQTTASSIISYASNNFPNQLTLPTAYIPLGGTVLSADLSSVGLKLAPSYVTSEVQNARNYIIAQNNKFIKYRDGFKYILDDYPIQLDFSFRNELAKAQADSVANLDILRAKSPIDCWKLPNKCVGIKADIQNSLPQINLPENYQLLSAVKVTKVGMNSIFWPDGVGAIPPSFDFLGYTHYQAYMPLDQRTGFYLINSQDVTQITGSRIISDPTDDGFSAAGTYHDGGACPMDDWYKVEKQVITVHVHRSGGCSADYTRQYPFITEYKPNPYYVDIDN